jgi:hypothetical protein
VKVYLGFISNLMALKNDRKYSAMTPGGMSRDLGNSYSSGRHGAGGAAVGGSKGKKATTLFLMPTLLARIARKFPSTFSRSVNVRRLGRKPFR